jgi:tetratricopeptide (TPR) repeat protein
MGHTYPSLRPDGAGERVRWFQAAPAANPGNLATFINLGVALADKGDRDAALDCFQQVVRLYPRSVIARHNLAVALAAKGKSDAAIVAYRETLRLDPKYASAHYNLGNALRDKGEQDAAIECYKEAVRAEPEYAAAHCGLGVCLLRRGETDAAIAALRTAARIDPADAVAPSTLGNALLAKGDTGAAVAWFKEAIRLNPKYDPAHNNLAWVLATGPDRLRDGKQAVEHATRACELTGWRNPNAINTLGVACAEVGDFDRAAAYQKRALTYPAYERAYGAEARRRLDLYARKKPYRDPDLVVREVAPPPRVLPAERTR